VPFTTHAAERAAERYGLTPTEADWSQCVLDIIDTVGGDRCAALLLRIFVDDKERWLVHLAGEEVVAIYDPNTATIITVQRARRSVENHTRPKQGDVWAGHPVERRTLRRWRFTSNEHIA
jgi:hypothetical protein